MLCLTLVHGTTCRFPPYLPDATLGVVRAVDAADLEACGIEAVVMNVFHLMQKPGSSTIAALGGLHRMAGWPHPIITDSGGFQAYSLIRQNPKFGKLSDRGHQLPAGGRRPQVPADAGEERAAADRLRRRHRDLPGRLHPCG